MHLVQPDSDFHLIPDLDRQNEYDSELHDCSMPYCQPLNPLKTIDKQSVTVVIQLRGQVNKLTNMTDQIESPHTNRYFCCSIDT